MDASDRTKARRRLNSVPHYNRVVSEADGEDGKRSETFSKSDVTEVVCGATRQVFPLAAHDHRNCMCVSLNGNNWTAT